MNNEHIDRLSNIICKAIDKAYDLDIRDELYIDDLMGMPLFDSVEAPLILDGQEIDFSLANPNGHQYSLNVVPRKGCNNFDLIDDYIEAFLESPEGEAFDVNTAVETEDDLLILFSVFTADSEDEAVEKVCDILRVVDPYYRPKELSALLALFR